MDKTIKKEIEELTPDLIAWRRDFHRHPEIAFQEFRTSGVIREFLERWGLEVKPMAKTGLRAVLKGGSSGTTVALRADMDALPLKEKGKKEYISQNPEATHACGHDGHMAILMGVVRILINRKENLPGNVVFLFQPSEELPPGGAEPMVKEGALDGVDAVFGLHLWQPLPTGAIGIVKGPMMAQADNFSLIVKGKAGHGSMPHTAVDPIYAASQLVVSLQSVVSRNNDPLKPLVVSFGTIQGGTIYNIIPESVALTGTVRTFQPEVQAMAKRRIQEISEKTGGALGAEVEFVYENGYPPLINAPEMVDFVKEVAGDILGEDRIVPFSPVMGGEDFAYYLQKKPGAFFFLGMGDGQHAPHHHPEFDLDEKALPLGTHLLAEIALEYLKKNRPV
ncbi:MAG: amidohydrolase [Candidatus Aminicenantes bacterium]|nr:amidohydrolase [Candidatus Aminicenantes bacterium]